MSKDNTNGAKSQPIIRKQPKLEEIEKGINVLFELRRDELTGKVEMNELSQAKKGWEPVNVNTIYRRLHHMKLRAPKSSVETLIGSDFVPMFNPIKEYFEQVITIKLDYDPFDKLFEYIVTPDVELAKNLLKNWMVNAIETIIDPTFFNKRVLVFFNQIQDSGKTSLARHFIPGVLIPYSTENNLMGKDGKITLSSCAFHILDEMEGMHKIGKQQFKSLVSLANVNVRWPYEKQETSKPRITSFIGTADRQSFLPEDTGTSRFFILELKHINFDYSLYVPTDHLWVKASELYSNGQHLVLSDSDKAKVEEINSRFIQGTFTSELLLDYFLPGTIDDYDTFYSTTEISRILEEESGLKVNTKTLGRSLNNLKFIRTSKSVKMANGKCEPRQVYLVKNVVTKKDKTHDTE